MVRTTGRDRWAPTLWVVVRRKVDVVPIRLLEAFPLDGLDHLGRRAVVENRRRLPHFVSKADLHAVALACPNALSVLAEGKSLLVVVEDDLFDH